MPTADHELARMETRDCWDLLRERNVGRVAVTIRGHPLIFPVNYVVDDSETDLSIVFRTDEGTKLDGLLNGPSTAFEIDEFDPDTRRGWSVVAAGASHVMTSPTAGRGAIDAEALSHLDTWTFGDMPFTVRLTPTSITGRTVG